MTDHTVVNLAVPREWVLTSNQRLGWRAEANRTSYIRGAAAWHGRAFVGKHKRELDLPFRHKMHATAYLRFPTERRRDPANWYPTVKAVVDGIVDAGVLEDDSVRFLVGPDMRQAELKSRPGAAVQVLVVMRRA